MNCTEHYKASGARSATASCQCNLRQQRNLRQQLNIFRFVEHSNPSYSPPQVGTTKPLSGGSCSAGLSPLAWSKTPKLPRPMGFIRLWS